MSAFKLSSVWQEDVAKNLSKLFSSNKPVEGHPTKPTSEAVSLKDEQTAVNPKAGKINEQTFSGSANKLFTDLAKVFQGSVDKEKPSAQEEPTASEATGLFPTSGLNQPEEGLRQKLGSFFSRTSKPKPEQSLAPPQTESVSSPDFNTDYQNGAPIPNQNDAAEKESLSKHITAVFGSSAEEKGERTLKVTCLETPSKQQIFEQSELVEQNNSEVANHEEIEINSSVSAQYKGSGRSEEKQNGSAHTSDPTAPQTLKQFNSCIPLQKDSNSSAYRRSLTKPQAGVNECKEINSHVLEDRVNGRDNFENEYNMSVPRTITYSTYCGARRIRRRRSQRKPFQPLNPTISEVDERNVTSLVDQKEEDTKHCVLLLTPEMTGIQTPLEENIPLIMGNESTSTNQSNNGKGNDESQPRTGREKCPSNRPELAKDEKSENEMPVQQSSFGEVNRDIELTEARQEITKIITDYSTVTVGTIDSIQKQTVQSSTSVSSTTSIQKMTGVNPDDVSVTSLTVALEDLYSKGSGMPKLDIKYLVQKDNPIIDHNDMSHKNEDFVDMTTATQTDSLPKTTVIVNAQQKSHTPSISKRINTKGIESDAPWAHGFTVDAVGTSTIQNFKPVNSNTLPSLENQQADNTGTQGKGIASQSAEDRTLGLPESIVFNQNDVEEQNIGPVSKGENQGQSVDISDNVTAEPILLISLTDPVKTIHLSNDVDTQKVKLNNKYDSQLEFTSGTQTVEHTTVSETVTVFGDEKSMPDVCTNVMPKEHKDKDNIIGLSTGSLTIETGYEIEKPPKKHNQTVQRSAAPDLTHVREETVSEIPNWQLNQNSSTLTTIEMMNEANIEETATSANESTATNDNGEVSKIPGTTDSKSATDTNLSTLQSNGVNSSESATATEHQEIADSSYLHTEKSLYIQKPDQLFKTSSVNECDHTSEFLQGTQVPLLEPKVPRTTMPSLLSESIFYRFYQESTQLLLDSDIHTNSTTNNEMVTIPVVKENQLAEEIQRNKEASNFVAMQQEANDSSRELNRKCSPSENSLWYRCFQQSSGLLNMEENVQLNVMSETYLENGQTNEMVQLTKASTHITNLAQEAVQGTLEGDALSNSRMTNSHEKNEEMAKNITTHDNENSNSAHSHKPENKETVLKIKEDREENIILQSGADLMKAMCAFDASQLHPDERVLTEDSVETLEGKAKEIKARMVSSAVQLIPHTETGSLTNQLGATNIKMGQELIQNAGLKNGMSNIDFNECRNELTINNTNEGELEELTKIRQERLKELPEEPVQIPEGESKDSHLVTPEDVSEYGPSILSADGESASIMVESHEIDNSTVPLLPVDTDTALVHPVKDIINQEGGTGLLNLITTGYETGITESTHKTIEINVSDHPISEMDPATETGQGSELRNIVDVAKDSLSTAPLEIIRTDNENFEPLAQEPSGTAAEQCNITDRIQSAGVLKTKSATSTQSNVSQESAMSGFKTGIATPEATSFQPDSGQSEVSQDSGSADQADAMNQNTTLKEDGIETPSKMLTSSNSLEFDSVRSLNEMAKRKIQKIQLSSVEEFKIIQGPDAVQLPPSESGIVCESDTALPSEINSAVDPGSFTEQVTPHAQTSSIGSKENVITAETGPDFVDNMRLMDKAKGIDLNQSTIPFRMNNSIIQEAGKLKKTLDVKDERLKVVVDSDIPEESENNSVEIPEGESKDSHLVTLKDVSEYGPSIHSADGESASIMVESHEKDISTVPLLPEDTDTALVHTVKDIITQEGGTGLLNLITTGYETGITESTHKTIEINVSDHPISEMDPATETGQGSELRNIVDVAKDSLSTAPLEIIRTDNENFEPLAQEPSGTAAEQCNITDRIQSAGVLKTKSATSTQSNVSQESAMSGFKTGIATPEATSFQPDSGQSEVSQDSGSADQADAMNQNTTLKEDGIETPSKMLTSSNSLEFDSVRSLNEMAKRKIQKIQLSSVEEFKIIQGPDAVQLPPSESGIVCESDTALPSEINSAVDPGSFTEQVTPHAQTSSIGSKQNVITAETGPDFVDNMRLMDKAKGIDLNQSTIPFRMNNSIIQEAGKLKKTLDVKDERLKVVVDSDIPEESENNSVEIPEGESKDSHLVTLKDVSEYGPSIHSADGESASIMVESHEKDISTVPLLPEDTDTALVHTVKDIITQEGGTGLLNLITTGYETGITESTHKTIEINVSDHPISEMDPATETGQGSELRNIVDVAKDSLSTAPLEIIRTDNENFEPLAQEPSGTAAEQCNITDRIQSAGVLKTKSATSTQSNVSQESAMSGFKTGIATPEATSFQPDSGQSEVSQDSGSADQADAMNQNTTLKEDGIETPSKMLTSSNSLEFDSVRSLNEMAKRKIQKIQLSSVEEFKIIQGPDAVQLPPSESGTVCESDTALPSEINSAVDPGSFTEQVTPHAQTSSIGSKENVITAETGPDFVDNMRLMDKAKGIDLNQSTIPFRMNNSIIQEAGKLKKTLDVKDERLKVVVDSDIPEESENNSVETPEGESKDSHLVTPEDVSEYGPSIHSADGESASIMVESHEKDISTVPLLPEDTDTALVHTVKDIITQEGGTGLLNLITTGYETGIAESTHKTIEINVSDHPINEMDPAKDSLTEAPSERFRTDNQVAVPMTQEPSARKIDQGEFADPLPSLSALFKATSVIETESHGVPELLMSDSEKSKSSQSANPSYFINASLKTMAEDDTRISDPQNIVGNLFAGEQNGQVSKGIEIIDNHLNNEKEMDLEFLEQEALVPDTSLGHSFMSWKYFGSGLPPIYEEQEAENEAAGDVYSITHSQTLITHHDSNDPVTSVPEPTTEASSLFVQRQNLVQEAEEEEQNLTSPVPAVEVSTSPSDDNLNKSTAMSLEMNENQELSSQFQTETCVVDSKTSHGARSSAAECSVFYRYFQSSRNFLPNIEEASLASTCEILTDSQHKLNQDSKLLKCSSDSKDLVGNKSLKINPRPGKVVIHDKLNFHGNKHEIFTDVPDATSWTFSEGVTLRVVRGCWILYEKPEFQGQTYVLEEGHRELDELWVDKSLQMKPSAVKIVIGSIKRIVKNHCIPEIVIFQETQQNEIKVYLHNEVTCLEEFGITPTVSSIVINSGIWLAYYKPNFDGHYALLEASHSSAPPSTEVMSNNVKSLRPLEMGGLKVERPMAPKVIIFEKSFFNGHSKEICKDASNLKTLWEDVADLNVNDIKGVGSIRVLGGVWVCYEKECYSGRQYLLEEGEYEDWQAWGGFDSTVQSMRYIQADYIKPEITLFVEANLKGDNTVFFNHDIPNLENIGHGTVTQSIEVKNGVWVVYHEERYCGEQYILEKGVYRNYTDWGGNDSCIMSLRPIQLEPVGEKKVQFQLQAYKGVDFQGESVEFVTEIPSLPNLQLNSFKVLQGCWVLYDEKEYRGHQYVLEEGQYPDLESLGCLSAKPIQSLKPIRNDFSMPSISLFSLYSFEGQELILTGGSNYWKDKGFYQMPKSVKVNSGIWVAYDHANFRGRQFLLECSEITDWNEFSKGRAIGSLHPLEHPRVYFQIKNKATGGFVTVVGDSEDPRGSKLSVCPYNGKPTQMWFYCNGLIQSKANYACIDAIGSQGKAGTKVNLWTEHNRTHQKWNINRDGTISSFLDFNLRLDIKGGDFYDKHNIILNSPEEQRQTQFWDIEVI
ncbi:uncharacterized protein LOC125457070 [Stegostoma tigrinum]|uniref:uncharacterized protein LOC125457070 n=1 Tax=Stegostoma tigrinum TaxID=3053191 RepID=UPI0028702056|nr:uncharacterized protein LOC125457070 [Stegostoma tigrinum]